MDHMAVFAELHPAIFLPNNPGYQMMNAIGYLVFKGYNLQRTRLPYGQVDFINFP